MRGPVRSPMRTLQDPQAGATTIILALILLALLSVGVMGLSRNSLRELIISGSSRQGAMARNVADSGIEWAIYWLDPANSLQASDSALELRNLKSLLNADNTLMGQPYDPHTLAPSAASRPSPPPDQTINTAAGFTQGYTLALTRMGSLDPADTGQGIGPGAFAPASGKPSTLTPQIWALRSDSQIQVGAGLFATKYFHSKEAWISIPPSN